MIFADSDAFDSHEIDHPDGIGIGVVSRDIATDGRDSDEIEREGMLVMHDE